MNITIYHNPRCSKSRQTLQLLEQHGIQPTIVLYLNDPPKHEELAELLNELNMPAKKLLRCKEAEYKTLDLGHADLTEAELIDVMIKHPKLIERPIVSNGKKAVLGRPPENVLELLS